MAIFFGKIRVKFFGSLHPKSKGKITQHKSGQSRADVKSLKLIEQKGHITNNGLF